MAESYSITCPSGSDADLNKKGLNLWTGCSRNPCVKVNTKVLVMWFGQQCCYTHAGQHFVLQSSSNEHVSQIESLSGLSISEDHTHKAMTPQCGPCEKGNEREPKKMIQ